MYACMSACWPILRNGNLTDRGHEVEAQGVSVRGLIGPKYSLRVTMMFGMIFIGEEDV
jgi:hypothetical protein